MSQHGHTFVDLSQRVFLMGDAEQSDPASHQPVADRWRSHTPTQDVWFVWKRKSSRHTRGFIMQPDVMENHLMIAGDIESNPGPLALARANSRGRAAARIHPGPQDDKKRCRKCNKKVSRENPLVCQECHHRFMIATQENRGTSVTKFASSRDLGLVHTAG